MIRHLRHADIDKAWWDAQLDRCVNKLWYAQSWVLDIASPGWEALVDDGSGMIMPLTWRRKFGVAYLYQPFMLQQLGVFAPSSDPDGCAMVLAAIPSRFRYWDICVNHTRYPGVPPALEVEQRVDQVVDLQPPLDLVRRAYGENHRRSLRKDPRTLDGWSRQIPLEEFWTFLSTSPQYHLWKVPSADGAMGHRLMQDTLERGQGWCAGVREEGLLVAGAFFVRWGDRIIFLKGITSASGRSLHAMHHLIDREIAQHAGGPMLLDFAGSNDPSLARFYAGFGAQTRPYLRLRLNRLPRPWRWLKR